MAATFLDVSPAVVHAVLTWLDVPSLGRMGRVSRRFRDATRDPLLWIGTRRINEDARVCGWRREAFDVYGRYVTTLRETGVTDDARQKFCAALRNLVRVGAPLTALTVDASLLTLKVLRSHCRRLASLRVLTVLGAPTLQAPLRFRGPVLVVLKHTDTTRVVGSDWIVACWTVFHNADAVMSVYAAQARIEIDYANNAVWPLVDVVTMALDVVRDANVVVAYRKPPRDEVSVAKALLGAFGSRMVCDPSPPRIAVYFRYTTKPFPSVVARLPDGSVECVGVLPPGFVMVRRT
jgi:hypothetical protein